MANYITKNYRPASDKQIARIQLSIVKEHSHNDYLCFLAKSRDFSKVSVNRASMLIDWLIKDTPTSINRVKKYLMRLPVTEEARDWAAAEAVKNSFIYQETDVDYIH